MNRFFRVAVLALMLVPSAGTAQDFDAGLAAANAGDFATAFREWLPLAEQGDMFAQSNLGFLYKSGQGVKQDYLEAVKWSQLAAEQGYAPAQTELGELYYHGQGVLQDYVAAAKWFVLAAEDGFPRAQTNLGLLYRNGEGVVQDYAEAVKWFKLGGQHGDDFAQFQLGGMYFHGEGVPQDFVTAHMWLNLSATSGNQTAAEVRDKMAYTMTPADISEAQRRARVCLATGYQDCD